MENLNFYYSIVEKAIANIGVDPQKARTKDAGKWTLTKGAIPIWIDVIYVKSGNRAYFRVASPVIKRTAANQAQMALDLLEINNALYGVAFSAHKELVFIKNIREAEGLDVNEANAMILRVGNYCEKYRKVLTDKYPATPPSPSNSGPFIPNMI